MISLSQLSGFKVEFNLLTFIRQKSNSSSPFQHLTLTFTFKDSKLMTCLTPPSQRCLLFSYRQWLMKANITPDQVQQIISRILNWVKKCIDNHSSDFHSDVILLMTISLSAMAGEFANCFYLLIKRIVSKTITAYIFHT